MKKNIWRILPTVLLLAMLLSLVACGGNNSSEKDGGQDGAGDAAAEKNTELNVALSGEPNALDPMCGATDRTSSAVYNNIYDTLLVADSEGNILPNLASYEMIDELTYEFKVFEGIKWHNGDELTAHDVAFTMKKGCDTAITKYIWGAIDPDSIEIINDYTLRVSTYEPAPALLALMTALPASILNEKYVTEVGDGSGTAPIGTGPYKFVEWSRGNSITLERFEDYHGETPDVSKVVFRFIPEATNRTIELESGTCDLAYEIQTSDLARVSENPDLTLFSGIGNSVRYIGFNCEKAPFDNVAVRQAIASAINVEGIVNAVKMGTGVVATNPIAPDIKYFNDDIELRPYDPEGAKAALAAAGYPNGLTTTIWVDEQKDRVDIATILQSQLAEIGVTAEIKVSEWSSHVTACYNGDIDIYVFSWSCACPDPSIIFNSVFSSQMLGQGGNCSRIVDDRIDELLDIGNTSMDDSEREAAYKELQQRVYDLVPWVPLWVDTIDIGAGGRIASMSVTATTAWAIKDVVLK
nr:ABC transporter substrate-binding protein [uncultured Oscillibacter sp.]